MGSGFEPGSNNGLRVAFELPQTSGGASGAMVYGNAVLYKSHGEVQLIPRSGRDDTTNFATHRAGPQAGGGATRIKIQAAQQYVVEAWRGKSKSLRIYYDPERYETVTAKIQSVQVSFDEPKGDERWADIAWVDESAHAFTWPAPANTGGDAESVATKQLWAGTNKTGDPKGLNLPAPTQVTYDWVSSVDNTTAGADAAEQTYLLTLVVAQIAPLTAPHSYKDRGWIFTREGINGGKIVFVWGLTDTEEDWINPRSATKIDPNKIQTGGTAAAINATPTIPTISGQTVVERVTTTEEINDSKTGKVTEYGQRTTQADTTYPNTHKDIDAGDVESTGISTQFYANGGGVPGAPDYSASGIKPIKHTEVRENLDEWKAIDEYGKLDGKDRIELLQSKATAEPGNVRKESVVVKVLDTATPVTDDTYNPDTTNLEFYTDEVHQITAAGTVHYVHVSTFKPLSPLNEDQEDFKQIADDPVTNLLADDHRRIEDANATTAAPAVTNIAGASMVCVKRITKKIGHTKYRHDFWYELRSLAAKLVADKTFTEIDASAIESEAMNAEVWLVSGGAPSAPTLSGFVLVKYRDVEIENPLYRLRIYFWGLVTNQTEIEQGSSEAIADPLSVYRSKVSTIVSHGGDSNKTVALAAAAANASDKEFVSARCKRMPKSATKALLTLTFTGEDSKVHGEVVQSDVYPYRGKPQAGFDTDTAFGDPDSYVLAIIPGPIIILGGYDSARTDYVYWERKRGKFLVRMRYITSTARKPSDFRFEAQRGKVNDAAFLGRAKYTCKFIGARQVYNGTLNSNHLVVVDLEFETDSQYFMNDKQLPLPGNRYKFYDNSLFLAQSGFIDPVAFYGPASALCAVLWPDTATMTSVFGITG